MLEWGHVPLLKEADSTIHTFPNLLLGVQIPVRKARNPTRPIIDQLLADETRNRIVPVGIVDLVRLGREPAQSLRNPYRNSLDLGLYPRPRPLSDKVIEPLDLTRHYLTHNRVRGKPPVRILFGHPEE
jgi:hypothetical protein